MGRIIYGKAKMSGNGMKMMTYTGKGAFPYMILSICR